MLFALIIAGLAYGIGFVTLRVLDKKSLPLKWSLGIPALLFVPLVYAESTTLGTEGSTMTAMFCVILFFSLRGRKSKDEKEEV